MPFKLSAVFVKRPRIEVHKYKEPYDNLQD